MVILIGADNSLKSNNFVLAETFIMIPVFTREEANVKQIREIPDHEIITQLNFNLM